MYAALAYYSPWNYTHRKREINIEDLIQLERFLKLIYLLINTKMNLKI